MIDERTSNRGFNDDESEDTYITAFHKLIQSHQQQQMMAQQEQENMLSTIFEASCEEATPMTSLIDVHQPRPQMSPHLPSIPMAEENRLDHSDQEEEQEEIEHNEEEEDERYEEKLMQEKFYHSKAPSFNSIDEIPVSTAFSKNESKISNKNFYSYDF